MGRPHQPTARASKALNAFCSLRGHRRAPASWSHADTPSTVTRAAGIRPLPGHPRLRRRPRIGIIMGAILTLNSPCNLNLSAVAGSCTVEVYTRRK